MYHYTNIQYLHNIRFDENQLIYRYPIGTINLSYVTKLLFLIRKKDTYNNISHLCPI